MTTLERFIAMLQEKVSAYHEQHHPTLTVKEVVIRPGKKYIKVDIGNSGKFMYDPAEDCLYGIKAYGVIHRGHNYGSPADLIKNGFCWDGYNIRH